jgi:hypothetical protein
MRLVLFYQSLLRFLRGRSVALGQGGADGKGGESLGESGEAEYFDVEQKRAAMSGGKSVGEIRVLTANTPALYQDPGHLGQPCRVL